MARICVRNENGEFQEIWASADSELSGTSSNSVQNKVIYEALDNKVDKVDGSRLITSYEASKLEALVIGDSGQIEVGGTVNADSVQGLDELLATKVDKITGKGLSTNDYTTAEKDKLAGIATGANKTVVDSALSSTSTNPVQNKIVKEAIDNLLSSQLGIAFNSGVELTHGEEFKVIKSVESKENILYPYSQTYKLPSETTLSLGTTSGSGNAVTDISVSGHQITLTKGETFSKSGHTHNVVTASTDGFMSSADKSTLDSLNSLVGTTPVQEQIENAINNISQNITTYNNPTQFGCTFASTITEVCNAIPNNSIFLCNAGSFTDSSWNLPSTYGTILAFKQAQNRNIFHFYGKDLNVGNYQMSFNGSNEPTGVWTCDLSSVLSSSMYGSTLPPAGTKGRIFFLKASE